MKERDSRKLIAITGGGFNCGEPLKYQEQLLKERPKSCFFLREKM